MENHIAINEKTVQFINTHLKPLKYEIEVQKEIDAEIKKQEEKSKSSNEEQYSDDLFYIKQYFAGVPSTPTDNTY